MAVARSLIGLVGKRDLHFEICAMRPYKTLLENVSAMVESSAQEFATPLCDNVQTEDGSSEDVVLIAAHSRGTYSRVYAGLASSVL